MSLPIAAPRRSQSGFTLIELLVVISIIATLAGLLIPAIGRARYNSNQLTDINNIRNIVTIMTAYGDENSRMPNAATATGTTITGNELAQKSMQLLAQWSSGDLANPKIWQSVVGARGPASVGSTNTDGTYNLTWEYTTIDNADAGSAYGYNVNSSVDLQSGIAIMSNGGDSKNVAIVALGNAPTRVTLNRATSKYTVAHPTAPDNPADDVHADDTSVTGITSRNDSWVLGVSVVHANLSGAESNTGLNPEGSGP